MYKYDYSKDVTFLDSKEVFEEALEKGFFSDKEGEDNYVGNFMYMCSFLTEDTGEFSCERKLIHEFKNSLTRKTLHFDPT